MTEDQIAMKNMDERKMVLVRKPEWSEKRGIRNAVGDADQSGALVKRVRNQGDVGKRENEWESGRGCKLCAIMWMWG